MLLKCPLERSHWTLPIFFKFANLVGKKQYHIFKFVLFHFFITGRVKHLSIIYLAVCLSIYLHTYTHTNTHTHIWNSFMNCFFMYLAHFSIRYLFLLILKLPYVISYWAFLSYFVIIFLFYLYLTCKYLLFFSFSFSGYWVMGKKMLPFQENKRF